MTSITQKASPDGRDASGNPAILASIDDILADMKIGKPVIIVDDEDRENEGDLIIAADTATPEAINFMAKEGRGLICLPMEGAMIDRLGLELMGRGNNTFHRTAFTVSIEAKEGVTTGISAADRAHTIRSAIDPKTKAHDIATPGHVFPLRARDGGVLVRAGHTEAAVDLAKMAGFSGAGVICEIMNDDGTMARLDDLMGFAGRHGLKIGSIADLIAYRRRKECLVKKLYTGQFESFYGGTFTMMIYASTLNDAEHIVLMKGDVTGKEPVLVRMHALNVLNDLLSGGLEGSDLHQSMTMIDKAGQGILVIIRESDQASLSQSLLQLENKTDKNQGVILRDYGIGAQILRDIGVKKMILLTNKPKAIAGLEGYDLEIVNFQPIKG
jgi:3,4-dihydroxy 2-butanone 4-phosphate synthase/GTP cyclohydrolase II